MRNYYYHHHHQRRRHQQSDPLLAQPLVDPASSSSLHHHHHHVHHNTTTYTPQRRTKQQLWGLTPNHSSSSPVGMELTKMTTHSHQQYRPPPTTTTTMIPTSSSNGQYMMPVVNTSTTKPTNTTTTSPPLTMIQYHHIRTNTNPIQDLSWNCLSHGCCCIQCVRTQEVGISETCGSFEQIIGPGLYITMLPCCTTIKSYLSLRIQQIDITCESKTKDNGNVLYRFVVSLRMCDVWVCVMCFGFD